MSGAVAAYLEGAPMQISHRLIASMLSAPLLIVACGGSAATSRSSPNPSGEHAMMMQPGAENMKVSILSPADGAVVTGNTVGVQVQTTGFTSKCNGAGTKDVAGAGHYHIEIDKSLVNMFCSSAASLISM